MPIETVFAFPSERLGRERGGSLAFSWNSDIQVSAQSRLERQLSLRGNFLNRQSRCISVAVKRRTKRPSAMNWMSPQRARCGSGAKPNNLTPSWCVLMRGDERESSFRQRAARAKQNLESGFGERRSPLRAQGCIQVCPQSSPSLSYWAAVLKQRGLSH